MTLYDVVATVLEVLTWWSLWLCFDAARARLAAAAAALLHDARPA